MDKIKIDNLEIFAYHGVFPEENKKGQRFYVSATLVTNTRDAGQQDDLSLSTNYGEVCQVIHRFVSEHIFQLIETIAERLAEVILLEFPLVKEVELEVFKPEAPIDLPFSNVSVKILRGWHKAYIACGSNLGDKEKNINLAIEMLGKDKYCKEIKCSSIFKTTPYGGVEQDNFLNGVMEIMTLYQPKELLDLLKEIESKANREQSIRWGPRTLDLDIIFYDTLILETKELTIPHIDMHHRDFVLRPLLELTKFYIHPVFHKSVVELFEELEENHII
ncbi:MAG TPA: 2-amino-4-hydroxy-6-hydroxymethyldihydropteridine diphosphokinase [Lachnospiraceae bacterium]|nr:2-amino-4-hydroxy-6-hydroxymethyldihydropteridine diphosphokinase [Lachnospiraceae bacterium]